MEWWGWLLTGVAVGIVLALGGIVLIIGTLGPRAPEHRDF